MARSYPADGDKVRVSIGAANIGGPVTMGFIGQIGSSRDTNSWAALMVMLSSVPAVAGYSLERTNTKKFEFGINNTTFSDNPTTTFDSTDGWCLILVTKATGTVAPRLHKYKFSTNAWVHENFSTAVANATAPGSSGFLEIGGAYLGTDYFRGDIEVAGVWDRALSDAEVENLPFTLMAWLASAPKALWKLDQSATGQKIVDLAGGGANESLLTGTAVSTASVPVFNYGDGVWVSSIVTAASTTPVSQTFALPYEATIGVTATTAAPLEAQAPVSATTISPFEALIAAAQTAVAPVDAAGGVSVAPVAPWDAPGAVSSPASVPFEATVALTSTTVLPLEAATAARATVAAAWEALLGVSTVWLNQWEADGNIPVSTTWPLPYEGLAAAVGDVVTPYEAAVRVAQTVLAPYEAAFALAQTAALPLEALAGLSGAWLSPWEADGGILVSATFALPYEARGLVSAALAVPWETIAPVSALLPGAWEALRSLQAATGLTLEALLNVTAVTGMPWEAEGQTLTPIVFAEIAGGRVTSGSTGYLDAPDTGTVSPPASGSASPAGVTR